MTLCPSCQQKRVILFGEHLENNVLYPVPHRQYMFSLPIMLRIYFKYDRSLLSKLCLSAYHSLLLFLRKHINLEQGVPGVALIIHTFGNYPDKFHPHVHLIVNDGLFRDTGTFYVMRDVDLKPLEEIFKATVFKMLKKEGKIDDNLIRKLSQWKHSGFSKTSPTRHFTRYGEGDYACSGGWPSLSGTHVKPYLGQEPTNQMVMMRVCDWWCREGDLLVENWVFVNIPDLLQQLGYDLFAELKEI